MRVSLGPLSLRQDQGQELVEYAIIAPILLLMFLGIIELGVVIMSYNTISNAAREGARFGAVINHQGDIPGTAVTSDCTSPATTIHAAACNLTTSLNPAEVDVTVTPIVRTVGSPAVAYIPAIEVQVEYDAALVTGIVIQALGGSGTLHLQATAAMALE